MNKERMLQLADYIENLPEHKFEMQYWLSHKVIAERWGNDVWVTDSYSAVNGRMTDLLEPLDCGTACCIAGWAAAIQNNFKPIAITQDGKTIEERAINWLGLTEREGKNLFLTGIDTVWTNYYEQFNYELDEDDDCYTGIKNKEASFVIKDIANGVIDIDKTIYYDDARDLLESLGHYQDYDY